MNEKKYAKRLYETEKRWFLAHRLPENYQTDFIRLFIFEQFIGVTF